MKGILLSIGFLLCLGEGAFAAVLEEKYPSYAHVFSEFDVDESYLYDRDFIVFVSKKEKMLKKFYTRSLERGKTVLPLMQGLLQEKSVSELFIYLSMIESGFKKDAVSPKKAVGLWQFMPATAKHYNLSVCQGNDERCDPVSATSAAIRYLNKLHRQFGKWYLAALAYNCGEGCVEKAIKRAHSKELSVLIDNDAKYLPRETRDYIRKILLIAMIGENALYDLGEIKVEDTNCVEVEVDKNTTIAAIARLLKMKKETLESLNMGSHERDKGEGSYLLRIPIEKIFTFYLRYNMPSLKTLEKEKSYMINHRVKMGESLESLVTLYETDLEVIKRVNHLEDDFLILDSILFIPISQEVFEKIP